jgi:hypothetical protein
MMYVQTVIACTFFAMLISVLGLVFMFCLVFYVVSVSVFNHFSFTCLLVFTVIMVADCN